MCFSKDDLTELSYAILRVEGPMTVQALKAHLEGYKQTRGLRITSMRIIFLMKTRVVPKQRLVKVGKTPAGAIVWGLEQLP